MHTIINYRSGSAALRKSSLVRTRPRFVAVWSEDTWVYFYLSALSSEWITSSPPGRKPCQPFAVRRTRTKRSAKNEARKITREKLRAASFPDRCEFTFGLTSAILAALRRDEIFLGASPPPPSSFADRCVRVGNSFGKELSSLTLEISYPMTNRLRRRVSRRIEYFLITFLFIIWKLFGEV